VSLRAAYDAAVGALAELGYPAPSRAVLGPTEGEVDAGDADVGIVQRPGGSVAVSVRVGTFETSEHRRRAALVHERIAARLGTRPVAPAPAAR
jgi:hypothetical protein